MQHATRILSIALVLVLAACGDKPGSRAGDDGHDHASAGPHGGQIVEMGNHAAHIEIIVDHGAEKIIAHVLTVKNEELRIETAPVLTLTFDDGPKTLTGVAVGGAEGGASEWHFRDKALAGEFDSGKLRIEWQGKPYDVHFGHDPEHDHGHEGDDGHDGDHEPDEDK